MTGPDHYREAERLLADAESRGDFNPTAQWCLELAKLHAALAKVAATGLSADGRAGRRCRPPVLRYESRLARAGQNLIVPSRQTLVRLALCTPIQRSDTTAPACLCYMTDCS
jgi:hypothetical protein